jgi:hypothetical protein
MVNSFWKDHEELNDVYIQLLLIFILTIDAIDAELAEDAVFKTTGN